MDVIIIDGGLSKNDDTDWTEEEADAFWDAFIDWIEARDVSFGGVLGLGPSGENDDTLASIAADLQKVNKAFRDTLMTGPVIHAKWFQMKYEMITDRLRKLTGLDQ